MDKMRRGSHSTSFGLRLMAFGLLAVVLLGCSPMARYNRLLKHHPELSPRIDSVSVKTWVAWYCVKDTVYVPSVELSIDTSGVIPPFVEVHVKEKKQGLTAQVDISKGRLVVTCREDSLRAVIESIRSDTITERYIVKVVKCPDYEHKATWYDIGAYVLSGLFMVLFAWTFFIK